MDSLQVAAIQMVSSTHPQENVRTMEKLVREAAAGGAQWVLLPEYWPLMGKQETDKLAFAEELDNGPFQVALSNLARELDIVLFGGTIPLQSPQADKVLNTMLVYGRNGDRLGAYDKMHLFGFTGLGERYAEADTIFAGAEVPKLNIDGMGVGQGVCYDLRFPEFFRAQQPFDVLLLPAAFTYTTGLAHWELLLRARAVENQCYVVASAQGGKHESGRRTFGHSMIIDPWGDVLAVLPEGEGVVSAQLSGERLASLRAKMPALQHRLL